MKDKIKNLFLPTENNGNSPILLSYFSFALLSVLAVVLVLSPATMRVRELAQLLGGPTFESADVIRLVNASRTDAGLRTLRENELLSIAAKTKAEDMAAKNYFAHNSPDGKTPWDFIRKTGYKYTAAGENLAMDFTSAQDAENAFMNSPTHRANILNTLYTEIGVSVTQDSYNGRPSIFVVQYFGKPTNQTVQAPKITAIPGAQELAKLPVATAKTPITAKAPAVLGTETLPDTEPTVDTSVRLLSFIVILFLLITLALTILRVGALPFEALARTLVLVIIFGYIATHSVVVKEAAQITPVSFSTVASQT